VASTRKRVTVYKAEGCHLCERALEVVEQVRRERDFDLQVVGIDDDPELEARYREWLPVVEIDGRRAFVYYVLAADLRRRLDARPEQ
jgi:glutaredoxin